MSDGADDSDETTTGLGLVGWLRWSWRQLTSMRVALMLLLLLAIGALPGSFFPQTPRDPSGVRQFFQDNPALAPWLERLGLFDVYASPWFSAVNLLLFISLIGCIIPRTIVHWRALRTPPPRIPRRFSRFPVQRTLHLSESPAVVQSTIMGRLRGRYRAVLTDEGISAERGYLRETGNIVFHLSLIGILLAFAAGQALTYRGQAIVIEEQSFANSVLDYDSFEQGVLFDPERMEPFTFTLDELRSEFTIDAQARDFAADVTIGEPNGTERAETLRVNHPVRAGGANVYLVGNGYAPNLEVRDGAGEIAFSGPVPFIPEDSVYTSRGVIKVPDVSPGLEQLGLTGLLLPTALLEEDGSGARSVHPQPNAPLLVLTLWAGDLGLDGGVPQNVYVLETDGMRQIFEEMPDGQPGSAQTGQQALVLLIEPGQTAELPEGLGSITWEGLPRFAALDLRYDPTLPYLLITSLAAIAGLFGSLFVPRRRVWIRLRQAPGGGTILTSAGLARGDDPGLPKDLDRVLDGAGSVLTTSNGRTPKQRRADPETHRQETRDP